MLRWCLGFAVLAASLPLAHAERRAYPGAILSNRSTPVNERSLEVSAHANKFIFLSTERLASGTVHVSDTRANNNPTPSPNRPPLCRTAKVRRIIKSSRGHVNCSANHELTATVDPNDTSYQLQYSHTLLESTKAWDITTGSDALIAVVVDTGIDYNHSDLQGNMWVNPLEIPNNRLDDDKNGYIDDIHGIDAIKNIGNPLDDHGHGTHVAGIIGAVGNNARGVTGVNWKVKLAGAKFLSSSGTGSTANAIKAITYATALKSAGHKVIATNNSWGGSSFSKPLLDTITAASNAGVLFIAAAGNSYRNIDSSPYYPASYQAPNVINVASVTSAGTLSSFSNYGPRTVHIAAPGSSIYSTVRGNGYAYKSGTSMAAPHVTGLALLLSSACERLDMGAIKSVLLTSAVKSDYLIGRVQNNALANASRAVLSAQATCQAPPGTPTPTPTPWPTPTPTPTVSIALSPTKVSAGQTFSFKASTGADYVNSGYVEMTLKGLDDTTYKCPFKNHLLFTRGQTALSIKMPTRAKHFKSLEMRFTSNRGTAQAILEITGNLPTIVPYSNAAVTCRDLASQLR